MARTRRRVPPDVAHVLYPSELRYALGDFFYSIEQKVAIAAARRAMATQPGARPELRAEDILYGARKCYPALAAELEQAMVSQELLHARNAS